MFKAKLSEPKIFVNAISTIGEILDEGIFVISKDGISLKSADRAMVAFVDFNISSSAFNEYELDVDRKIGLNITNLLSLLKRVNSNDKMTLNLHDSKLEITLEGTSKRKFVMPLLDISQDDIPPVDQFDFASKVEINPQILESGIDDADIISDSAILETAGDKFVIRAEGGISKSELELERGNQNLISLEGDGIVRSRYPIDYLKKMVKAAKIADKVTIKLGQDYPMRMEFKSGDKVSLSFVLAPRESDSD